MAGNQLFRSLLNNLTSSFVVDEKPFDHWSDKTNSDIQKYSRSICKISQRRGFKLKWHIANPEELAFVKVLTTKFFMKSPGP